MFLCLIHWAAAVKCFQFPLHRSRRPSANFGSSNIWHHGEARFDKFIGTEGSNGVLLGLNAPYGGAARWPKLGEALATPSGERLDDWNHGSGWRPSTRPGMALCIGAARSGKGAGIIVPSLLNYTGNVVVNDPKGEIFWITGDRRRKNAADGGLGKKTVLADLFGTVNREYGSLAGVVEKVTRYIPLAELDASSPDFPEDVAAIGEALTIDMGGGDNSNFFSGSSRDMIDGLIAATVTDAPPGRGHAAQRAAMAQFGQRHFRRCDSRLLRQVSQLTRRGET